MWKCGASGGSVAGFTARSKSTTTAVTGATFDALSEGLTDRTFSVWARPGSARRIGTTTRARVRMGWSLRRRGRSLDHGIPGPAQGRDGIGARAQARRAGVVAHLHRVCADPDARHAHRARILAVHARGKRAALGFVARVERGQEFRGQGAALAHHAIEQ